MSQIDNRLEAITITLPLNELLEILRVALGQTAVGVSAQTERMMRIEVISSLQDMCVDEATITQTVRSTFSEPLGMTLKQHAGGTSRCLFQQKAGNGSIDCEPRIRMRVPVHAIFPLRSSRRSSFLGRSVSNERRRGQHQKAWHTQFARDSSARCGGAACSPL